MNHANVLALVDYGVFRTSLENREKYRRAFWYISPQPQIRTLGENQGSLWVVTSRKDSEGSLWYSLAYRLAHCRPMNVSNELKEKLNYKKEQRVYGVEADPSKCWHYPPNEMTYALLGLRFDPYHPIRVKGIIGQSLQRIRWLNDDDVKLLEHYSRDLPHRRNVFISYSRKDEDIANTIEAFLESHKLSVWRDIHSLRAGDDWKKAIDHAINNSDFFILLESLHSAESVWVKYEFSEAAKICGKPGMLRSIVPVITSDSALLKFKKMVEFRQLEKYHQLDWTRKTSPEHFCDRLAADLWQKLRKAQ
jgi:hypothetical protein